MNPDPPTFVLVPGMGATAFSWTPVVQELALLGHRSLPVELPGHGYDTVFPAGYQGSQQLAELVGAPSPIAGLTLDDYAEHTLDVVRTVAAHGPVVLVGHSLGGATVTRVANVAPELLNRIVYLCAYCCVRLPNVAAYAPAPQSPNHRSEDDPLAKARALAWFGDPRTIGAARTNPRTDNPEVLTALHALLFEDLDPARVPAALNYALQPDEPIHPLIGDARVDPDSWPKIPRSYLRTTLDRVLSPSVQDQMITEADELSPANPFDVHTINAGHLVLLTRPAEVASVLAALQR